VGGGLWLTPFSHHTAHASSPPMVELSAPSNRATPQQRTPWPARHAGHTGWAAILRPIPPPHTASSHALHLPAAISLLPHTASSHRLLTRPAPPRRSQPPSPHRLLTPPPRTPCTPPQLSASFPTPPPHTASLHALHPAAALSLLPHTASSHALHPPAALSRVGPVAGQGRRRQAAPKDCGPGAAQQGAAGARWRAGRAGRTCVRQARATVFPVGKPTVYTAYVPY